MDLTLKITADADDAKKDLADVEQGIKNVEASAKSTTPALQQTVMALTGQTGATQSLNQQQTALLATQLASGRALKDVTIPGVNAATSATGAFAGAVSSLAGPLKIVGGLLALNEVKQFAGQVVDAVHDVIDFSSAITDLSSRTGIGTTELQRLAHAGDLVGVSIGQTAQAITQMQNRLAEGDKSALAALEDLELTFGHIKDLDPGRQFEIIGERIGQIEDPMKRTQMAMDLFGRTGSQVMPLLRSDIDALGDRAERLGIVFREDLVRGADRVGDSFTILAATGRGLVAQAIEPWVRNFNVLASAIFLVEANWRSLVSSLSNANIAPFRAFEHIQMMTDTSSLNTPKIPGAPNLGPGPIQPITLSEGQQGLIERELARELQEVRRQQDAAMRELEQWKQHLAELTGQALITDLREWERALKDIGGVTNLTSEAQMDLVDAVGKATARYGDLERVGVGAMTRIGREALIAASAMKVVNGFTNIAGQLPGRFDATQFFIPGTTIPNTLQVRNGLPVQPTPTPFGPPINFLPGEQLPFNPFNLRFPTLPQTNLANQFPGGVLPGEQLPLPVPPEFKDPGMFGKLFGDEFGTAMGQSILQAIQGGGNIWQSVGSTIGLSIGGQIGKSLSKSVGGFAGDLLGSLLPGIGALLGPLLDSITSMFDDRGRDLVEDFAATFSRRNPITGEMTDGFESLHEELLRMGDAGEQLWITLTQGVGQNNPEQAQRAIEEVTQAMRDYEQAVKDIVAGTNRRAANITSQADINVVGAGAAAAFALQIQQGASAIEAFQNLTPAIQAMREALKDGELVATAAADRLLYLGGILENNAVQFENAAASGQILSAMLQGNIRDADLFAAVSADIGLQLQTIIDNGTPMAEVFALAQPQLQALWEAQQRWGFAVDETTQALLTEAEAQGFVGEQMRSVHERVLQVLIAIADVLGADIPDALRGLPDAAADAAAGIQDAFGDIRLEVPVDFDWADWENQPPRGHLLDAGMNTEAPEDVPGIHEQRVHTGGFLWDGQVWPTQTMHSGGVVTPLSVQPTLMSAPTALSTAHPGGVLWNGQAWPVQTMHTGGIVATRSTPLPMLTAIAPTLGTAHSEGFLWDGKAWPMRRMHGGGSMGLSADEFPIVAQSGEFVMQRSAVQHYGVETMRQMNSRTWSPRLGEPAEEPVAELSAPRLSPPHAHTGGFLWNNQAWPTTTMHDGGLANDVFPLIAQNDVSMMRRSAVNYWGADALHRMNDVPLRPITASSGEKSGDTSMTVIFEEDGRRKAEYLIRHIPGAVKRIGKA